MRRSLRSSVSARAGWTVADQALSSLSNLVLTALVARTSSPHVFGIFGLAFAGYVAVLGMSRALATEPLVVRFGMKSADHVAMEAGPAAGSAAAVGLIGTLAFAVCAFATDGESRVVLALFAAAVPFLLIQDAWRFVFIASRVPRRALENDGIWVLAEVLVLAPIAVAGRLTTPLVILAWGLGGAVAAIAGAWRARIAPRPRRAHIWLRDSRRFVLPYVGEFVVATGAPLLATVCVVGFAGIEASAALRGAQTLYGPITMFEVAAVVVMIAEGTRLQGTSRLGPFFRGGTAVAVCSALAWTGVALVLPASAGRMLLGATWPLAHAIALPMGLIVAANALKSGAVAAVRAAQLTSVGVALRVALAPLTILAAAVGAGVAGVSGAAYAQAAASLAGSLAWLWTYRRHTRRPRQKVASIAASAGVAP